MSKVRKKNSDVDELEDQLRRLVNVVKAFGETMYFEGDMQDDSDGELKAAGADVITEIDKAEALLTKYER